jgi:hypothetical protein
VGACCAGARIARPIKIRRPGTIDRLGSYMFPYYLKPHSVER